MRKVKIGWLDIILLILLAGGLGYFAYVVESRLDYTWRWEAIPKYLVRYDQEEGRWVTNFLLEGLFTTIRISVLATIIGSLLGLLMGLARTSRSGFFRLLGAGYVEFVRNLPPLVLVFLFYFFFSDYIAQVLGVEQMVRNAPEWLQSIMRVALAEPPRFTAFFSAAITIALYEGAFITEIVRAGIQSVEYGQWEAAYALGLSRWQRLRHVILPQAFTRIVPPLAGQFISTIKDSSIVSVISVSELTFQGMELMASTYLTFEIWITVALLYFCMTFTLSMLARRLETRLARKLV